MAVKTFFKKNGLPGLMRRLKDAHKGFVKVGVNSEDAAKNKETQTDGVGSSSLSLKVIDVATFHEFGTKDIPERSFIRSNDRKNKDKYKKMIQNGMIKVLKGELEPFQVLGLVGEQVTSDIKGGITAGLKPDLDPKTIERKGSSKPLIDTGQLLNSITYKVGGAKKSSSESKLGKDIGKKADKLTKKIKKISKSSAKTASKKYKKVKKSFRKALK